MSTHPDDRFHPPTSADPFWTETCWFTFAVPERKLSGQLYPFFRPNQGVTTGGAFIWDPSGSQIWNCVYAKNLWHLPIPKDQDLSDIQLANGIHYRCLEPLKRYTFYSAMLVRASLTQTRQILTDYRLYAKMIPYMDRAEYNEIVMRGSSNFLIVVPSAVRI